MRRPPCMRFRAAWLLVVMALSALPPRGGEQPAVDSPPGASAAGWRALATPPVTPRTGSTTAWTGEEALFLGGTTKRLCPPAASCVEPARTARDGAAYNPSDGTWRRTAPAPVELPGYGHAPIVGDDVFQLIDDELQVYDASADAWRTEPGSPGGRSLVAARGWRQTRCPPTAATGPVLRRPGLRPEHRQVGAVAEGPARAVLRTGRHLVAARDSC
jgi:hypothetical protein